MHPTFRELGNFVRLLHPMNALNYSLSMEIHNRHFVIFGIFFFFSVFFFESQMKSKASHNDFVCCSRLNFRRKQRQKQNDNYIYCALHFLKKRLHQKSRVCHICYREIFKSARQSNKKNVRANLWMDFFRRKRLFFWAHVRCTAPRHK